MRSLAVIGGWAHTRPSLDKLAVRLFSDFEVKCYSLNDLSAEGLSYADGVGRLIADGQIVVAWSTGAIAVLEALSRKLISPAGIVLFSATARFCSDGEYEFGVPEKNVLFMERSLNRNPERVLDSFYKDAYYPASLDEEMLTGLSGLAIAEGVDVLKAGLRYLRESDLRGSLKGVDLPAAVVHGDEDRIIPWKAGEYLSGQLSNCSFTKLTGSGHCAVIEQAEKSAEIIAEFVENRVE